MVQLKESILKVVAYFDMFNYPITREEIRLFLDQPADDVTLGPVIQSLVEKDMLWQLGQFYSLRNDPLLAERRLNGNKLAVKRIRLARKVAGVIAWFPFVRGVAISGSLSKNFAYKGSDLDFFIITAGNRLWIAKLLLQIAVRICMAIGLNKWCCLNYYIDEEALEIEERNTFTAVEVLTLLPARGRLAFQRFFAANQWAHKYLPNGVHRELPRREISSWPLKWLAESLLNNRLGNSFDNWLMEYHCRRWEQQLAMNKMMSNGVPLGSVDASRHICKPDVRFFQTQVLTKFQAKLTEINHTHASKVG
jgi:hypothetical protein